MVRVWKIIFAFLCTVLIDSIEASYRCGVRENEFTPLIHHGFRAQEAEWPWHVGLFYKTSDSSPEYGCGGTLIGPKHVLTSAACVLNPETDLPRPEASIELHLGQQNLYDISQYVQIRNISKVHIHPKNSTSQINIAVLEMSFPVNYTDSVIPICLHQHADTELRTLKGRRGWITGWGYTERGNLSNVLQTASMPVADMLECLKDERHLLGIYLNSNLFCAGDRNGTIPGVGDSGSGLYFFEGDRWMLGGILFFAKAYDKNSDIDGSKFAKFCNVAWYLSWINDIVGEFELKDSIRPTIINEQALYHVYTDPIEILVTEGQRNVSLLCQLRRPIRFCTIAFPNNEHILLKPGDPRKNGLTYFGAGLVSGDCGVTIDRITRAHNGDLKCRLFSDESYEGSINVVVAVAPKPPQILLVKPSSAASLEVDTVIEAHCGAKFGNPAAELFWFLDDEPIYEGVSRPAYSEEDQGYSSQLTLLHKIRARDSGKRLICRAKHIAYPEGMSETSLQITVNTLWLKYNKIRPTDLEGYEEPVVEINIVGGSEVDIADFPYQLSLRYYGDHICGASVISGNWALSAAHCTVFPVTTESATLHGGSANRFSGGKIFFVAQIVNHPQYSANSSYDDVSVLRSTTSFSGANISPIAIVPSGTNFGGGTRSVVSGWGLTSAGGSLATILRAVNIPVVTLAACRNQWGTYNPISDNMVCAGELGRDSCIFDSGGPLVTGKRQFGIVSRGGVCGGYLPGVYTNIGADSIHNFIRSTTGVSGATRGFGVSGATRGFWEPRFLVFFFLFMLVCRNSKTSNL